MISKICSPKLTVQNLSEQLKQWKNPYLQEVKKTTQQFHEKVQHHRKKLIEKQREKLQDVKQTYNTETNCQGEFSHASESDRQQRGMRSAQPIAKQNLNNNNNNKHLYTQQRTNSQIMQPKLQLWRSNNQYGFKDYDELVKNYGQVFTKKQKVRKNHKDQQIEDFRADQRQMVQQIYNDLKNTNDLTVQFQAIQQFFENYQLFYYFYNIHPYRLLNLLKQSAKKFKNKLTKSQFFDFFLIDRPTIAEIKSATQKTICNTSVLPEQVWKKLKSIFDTLDTFGNEKICIKTFFQRIRNHPSCISLLSAEAVQFPEIGRTYTLQKVLFDLENKLDFDRKVQWQTIQDLIYNFTHIQEPTIDIIYSKNIQKAIITKKTNYFLLQPKVLQIIKEIFNRCPKYCGCFVKTVFFSCQLLETGLLKPYLNHATQIQNKSKNSYLSFEQVIKKLSKQAPRYIDMDQMLEFISIKGYQDEKKFVQLYDQIQTSSDQEQTVQQKQQRRLKKIKSLQNLKKNLKKKEKKKPIQVTQIKQFNLYKRDRPTIREQKVQQMIKEKQAEVQAQLKKKFKAKSIPVSLNPQRYQKYVKCLQQKKQSILNRLGLQRQQDQAIIDYLKTNTKLFEPRKQKPHCQQMKENYVFEPTPLPLHISQQLLPKIQAQKQQRKKQILTENLKKYHQLYWKNMRNTSSFDKEEQSLLQKINLIQQRKNFEQIKAHKVPNFDQLHRKFQQQLQNKKRRFNPTKIEQFKLSSPSNRKKTEQYMSPKSHQFKSASPPRNQPNVQIKSTKKYNDLVAFNHTKMAQRELQQLKKQKQQEERQIRQKNFAKMMRKNLSKCTNNTDLLKQKSEQKIKNFKSYISRLESQTQQQLASIYQRVLQRPFLFQQATATRKPISKQKPKRIRVQKASPEHLQKHPYKQGLFEKEDQQFHPIQSQNLNQSF